MSTSAPAPDSLALAEATAVAWHGRGVLLRGRSGSGKSALALRLIEAGAWLVADDVVVLRRHRGRLLASARPPLGLIEARGSGIFRLAAARGVPLGLVVALGSADEPERLPEPWSETFLGAALPCITLPAAAPDARARILLAIAAGRAA